MKILVLTVTVLNFVTGFPYNGNQETHSQTNHLSANPPLSASESHTSSQLSSILRTKNNSAPTDDSNSYSKSTDTITRHSGSLSKRNHSETLQASMYNFPPFGNDVPSNPSAYQTSGSFAYVEGTEGNYIQAESPMSNVSPSSAAMQDTSAVDITIPRFVPSSTITKSKMAVSGENSISAPVSITSHQYKSDSIAIPHYQRDSKATQSLEPFFPSTGRSKPFFASNPAAYRQNTKNGFSGSADESNTAISNINNLLGTYTTTREEEARPESISFIGTTTLTKGGNTATIDATDILEDYTTLFDVPDMEDEFIIITDTTYLERYGKAMSNAPDVPQKDNSIVIDAIDKKNHHRTIPSISFAKNTNDFESFPILSTYNKADTKSTMTVTDADEATSSINPTTDSFLNYRMHKKSNTVISNFNDTRTMLDVAKNMKHARDSIISKTNGITSTKHYANPNAIVPTTNKNNNFKITWPSKEDTIEGRHLVEMENTMTPYNNNTAEATGFKLNGSVIEFHSNIPASVHLKPDRNYFKYVSNDEIEEVIPVVQQTTNMDQDDVVIEEVILLHPEIRRKVYSLKPDMDYAQTAENKIILLSEIPDTFNLLFKNKIMPFTIDGTNLIKNRGDHRTPITTTANDTKDKMDIERTSVFKTSDLQSNITPIITYPGTAGTIYFHEDHVVDMTSASKFSMTPSDKSTNSVDETISLSTNNNHASSGTGPNPETGFPMNKGYTLLSVAESSTLMPKAQNNEAPKSLLIKDNSLTDAWISDPIAKNPHLINDAIIQKWKINKVSVDPSNIPLESTFLILNFTSPTDEHRVGKGTTKMTANSELMINKATIPEGRPTIALNSLPAKTAGIITQKQRFGSLTAKERTNEEESMPYIEGKSAVGEDGIFQIKEDRLPAQLSSGFERNGFAAVDSTKSLSKLSSSKPTAEVIVSDRDFTTPGEENVDVLYDVTKPANGKIYFKTTVTKETVNGLDKNAAVKQNVEAADGTEFLPPSNSVFRSRKDHPILFYLYYPAIIDNPLTITKENPNVAQNTTQHKLSLFAMDNADLTDYRDDYQTLAAIMSSSAKRLINKGKMAGMEITNIPPRSPVIANDISNVDKNTDSLTDLASTVFPSPITKGILTKNEVNSPNNKPNKLGDDFSISRGDPSVSTDDGRLLVADSSAFMHSVDPFNHPHATNPIKKISLADIIIPKSFYNKSIPAALTGAVTVASHGDVDTMLYGTQYESKHPSKEDITLNSEAYPQNDMGITAKEDGLRVENVKDNIYVILTSGGNGPEGNNLTAKHYSLHSDVYNPTRFKGKTKTIADQLEFENPASSYMTEVSKPLLRKLTPEFQEKVIVRNTNSDAEYDSFFGSDILYPVMKENVPKGTIFAPERSTFITPDFRIPMENNINSAPEDTVLLDKRTSHTNYASYTAEQNDPGTEKDQTAIESTTNSHTGIIPVTFSIPIPSEDTNVKNYYHVSGTGTPLSLGYTNTLRDYSYILRPETTLEKENNLDAMDLIITEPDKSDSEYTSNKHSFELEKEESSSIKKPIPFIPGPNGLVSHSTSPKGVASNSLLYRITHPELKTKEKYQAIILKEKSSDSDTVAASFKDYTKNFNTQHLKTVAPSLMDTTETFSSEFLERSSGGEETLREDDNIIILPKITDLGSKTNKYLFATYPETIVTMGENTFGTVPTDHAELTIPIKSQSHPFRKGISSTGGNTNIPELADSIKSEKSKVNENKSDLSKVMPSQDHMHHLTQDIASQAKNISYVGEVTKGIIKKASVASLNPVSATNMPTYVTTISPNAPAFDSKESNKNADFAMPGRDDVLSIKLKSLLIPNHKKPRIVDVLSQNDSLSNKSVALEPQGEHSIITDQTWEITKVQSNPQSFSVVSSVPLKNPTMISDNPINVATDIPENEGIYDETGTMAFVPNTVLQPAIHKKEQIKKSSDYTINHHINKAIIKPSVKEITTSGTGTNAFLGKDKAIVEDESYISEAKIPVILREVNSMNIYPFILKPYVVSAEKKAPGTLKETLYPDSTMSMTKLRKAGTDGSFSLGNDNLKRAITNSYNSYAPVKSTLPSTDFLDKFINTNKFININNPEFDPVHAVRESNIKMTDESLIARDDIVLPDRDIISHDNIIFIDDIKNIMNSKRQTDSTENDNAGQYEVIPFTKDFSAGPDVIFLAEKNNPNDMNLMTSGFDDNTFKYSSEKNILYVGEKGKSPTTKTYPSVQGLHRYGFHAPFPTALVTESLLNDNLVEPNTKQKYKMLISRKENRDSDKDGTFLNDYTAKFKSKSPRTMTHLPTNGNRKESPKFPDDLSLEKDILSGNDIIITLPEGKWIEHINAPDPESVETMGESKMFPDEITDLIMSTTPVRNKGQLYRTYITFTAPYYQREPEMPPKSEYNQDERFKAESYHSWKATVPSTTFNISLDNNELPFVDESYRNKKNRALVSSSPIRINHTVADTTALSLENSYERRDSMQLDEHNVRSNELPSLLTSERIILVPKVLTKDSVLMSGNSSTDHFIHGNDISENQDIKIQTDLQPFLDSNIPSNDSVTFTRNSTDDESDSVPTTERETVNIFEVNIDVQPLGAMMKVLLPTEISPFHSKIKKMAELSAEAHKAAKFDLNHITNATVIIPILENTLPSIPVPSGLSKTNTKEEKHSISKAGNFVSGDSRMLKDNPFFGKFSISARPHTPPNLKRTLSADSTMSLEKTLKPKYKNSAPPEERAGTAGLLHNAPTGSDMLLQKSILPPDFIMSVSSPNYSEVDPVKMKNDTTTNTFNNIPFEERNTPSHKSITSPSSNTSTKGMVNTIFNKRFVHRNSRGKDIITEYEMVPITENISDITLDGENISNIEDVIITVPDNRALEYATNEYVLEPQEEEHNTIINKITLIYDPEIVGSHQFYSSADTSEHLSQGDPNEIKTEEILQNLLSRKDHASSDLDGIVLKSSTDNSNSQAPTSVTHPLTHRSESIHKFLGKTTLERDTLQGDDTINIFPEDKMMEYTLVSDPEIMVPKADRRIFPDEPMHPIVTTSPLKNKNQFFKKVISSAIYNTDAQSETENILLYQAENVKGKSNMAEMQHSWKSIIPLAEFTVLPKGKLPFISEDTEILNKRVSISYLPMDTVNPEDENTTPSTDSSYKIDDSMLPEDGIRSRGFLPLQIPEKAMLIPNVSTENLEISDPVTNTSLANSSTALSNTFKTMTEYPNSINDSDSPIKNKTDLKPYSLISTKLPIGSTIFSDNPTNNEFESLSSANRETIDVSKTEAHKIYYKPQRKIMKAFPLIKVFQQRVPEERKIAIFSDQEDPVAKSDLSQITKRTILRNANIFNPAMKKILPSVTELNTLYKSDNNVEGEVHISKAGNFFPKDVSTLKDNSFTVKFDAASTNPQAPPNLKGVFSVGSTLILPEASRSKDTTTKTNNNIPPEERNTPSDKTIISPTIILQKKGMKNPINIINNNKFRDETFKGKDIFSEVVHFTEDISEEAHDTLLAEDNIPKDENIVIMTPDDSTLDYVADNYVFELVRERNGALRRKTTLSNDSNVFKSHSSHTSDAVSENASQGSPANLKTTKKHQSFTPKEKNLNSDDDATVFKSSSVNFNTKVPRSMVYSLTDSSWVFLPEFLDETTIENSSPIGGNTIIILPKGKRRESLFVPDSEPMKRMGERKIFTTDSINPAVITYPIEYKDQFKRKGVSFALYNHDVPNEAKTTIPTKFNANKHKSNLADMPHSQNTIPLTEFTVIPDDDLPRIGKNTEKANRAPIFTSSMNKAANTVADSIFLSTKGSYEGGDSMLPGKDIKSREFSSLLTSVMLIPNSLPENPETSGLITDKSLPESVKNNKLEMLERATEYADAINGGDVSERQVIISQADISSYPLAGNTFPTESTTFSDHSIVGEVDSFFSLNRDTPENYKTKTDKIYFNSQRAMMKDLSLREDSQEGIYERRKVANLFDQGDPAAKLELHNFANTIIFIPAMRKILPSGTEPNSLSKGDSHTEDSFPVKFNAISYKPQTPPKLKAIFLSDSTLTHAEDVRPTSHDEVTNTEVSITNIPTGLHGLEWRSTSSPSDFTTSLGTSKYSELDPVTSMGKGMTKEIDFNIRHKKIIIPSDKAIISPIITSEKDMASTLQGNISEQKDLMKSQTAGEYGITYFTEDISERVGDISSAGKITPAYLDDTTMTSDDSGSEYGSDVHAFELEDRANNTLIKMGALIYSPKTHVSHAPYTIVAASDGLSKTLSPVFKAKENYQRMIPRQKNSADTEANALKNSNPNVSNKAHRLTTHFLIDASKNFPSRFSGKTTAGKSTINGDDDTIIPSEGFDLKNKKTEYSLSPDIKPVVDSKTFTTDTTNHAFRNSDGFLRRNTSPTIYKTFTLRRADATTSSISDFTEDQTGRATVSDSRSSNFPLAQLSSDDISNVKENTEDANTTALTFFYPLKNISANMPYASAFSTKNKNSIAHYNLPSSESIRSLRLASMGRPEILILTSIDPTKETAAPKLIKGTNIYYPIVLDSAASGPVSIDSPYFNKGIASEGQNSRSQRVPKAFPLVYTVLQADSTGSSGNMANIEVNTTTTNISKSKIFDIDDFVDRNSEPKKTTTKFSTFFPNEYSKPNFYHTREVTKASSVKDTAEVNHLTDVNKITGNDAVIQVETNSLKDADLKPQLLNKNVNAGNKSGNKDDDTVPVAAYSSFYKPKNSFQGGYVPRETYFITGKSNLLTEAIDIIPTDEKSLSYT